MNKADEREERGAFNIPYPYSASRSVMGYGYMLHTPYNRTERYTVLTPRGTGGLDSNTRAYTFSSRNFRSKFPGRFELWTNSSDSLENVSSDLRHSKHRTKLEIQPANGFDIRRAARTSFSSEFSQQNSATPTRTDWRRTKSKENRRNESFRNPQ